MNRDDPLAEAFDPASVTYFTQFLSPPDGMSFEQAIGTTFTLDLETALIPPLMVLGLTGDHEDTRSQGAKLALNLRHAVEQMTVFMEAGHLSNRRADDEIHVLLAPMLREVLVPKKVEGHRSFHPKVWVVHFTCETGERDDVVRVVVSSRNLTRSISRDAMVMLEGRVGSDKIALNEPIASFLRYLPTLVVSHGSRGESAIETTSKAEKLANLMERTALKAPNGFRFTGFMFTGPERPETWSPRRCDRLTLISPFCDERTLESYRRKSGAGELYLASRQGTIASLPPAMLDRNKKHPWVAYVFDEAARPDDETAFDGDGEIVCASTTERSEQLHAKIFLEERRGLRTRTTIGSGNATAPAHDGRNVEVYATLTSPSDRKPLVPSFNDLEEDGTHGFATMLRPYEAMEVVELESQEEDDEFDPTFRFAIYELMDRHLSLTFAADSKSDRWICTIECSTTPEWKSIPGIEVLVKPTPAAEAAFVSVTGWHEGVSYEFAPTALLELSPFMTFRLTNAAGAIETFTTQLSHTGFPVDRHLSAVMRRRMPAASDWLDALAAALGMPASQQGRGSDILSDGSEKWGSSLTMTTHLFEALVANLDEPQSLAAFDRTLTAFGEVLASDVEDGEDVEALATQRRLHLELSNFWKPFARFLSEKKKDLRASK